MDVKEYFEILSLIIAAASLIALIVYVVKTWEMAAATRKAAEATERSVAEMREARDQETAPYVVIYFEVPFGTEHIYLVVKNIGRSVATDVKLMFTPTLVTGDNSPPIESLSFIKDGIKSMPPNYEIRTFFDTMHSYYKKTSVTMEYDVQVSYYGGLNAEKRIHKQVLDLKPYIGISYITSKGINDLVKEFKEFLKETKKIRETTDEISTTLQTGILIGNSSLMIAQVQQQQDQWFKAIISKLREFENIWLVSSKHDRAKGLISSRLQAHILLISEHLLTLHANRPETVSTELFDSVAAIATHLHELGHMRLYMGSIERFNELGDTIAQEIHKVKDQLKVLRKAHQTNVQDFENAEESTSYSEDDFLSDANSEPNDSSSTIHGN